MSNDALHWARHQKTGSISAKFVLVMLADHAGTDYSCYPSVATLAQECEMGESTVRAATRLLAELGLVRVFYRHRKDGSRRSCRYQLMVEGADTMEPDAEDWADYRRISADAMRQDPAGVPLTADGEPRQDLAVIPSAEPSPVEAPPVNRSAPRSDRATRVPDDFQPTEEMRAWFVAEKLGQVIDGRIEHEKFMDYWRAEPGTRGRKLDWPATWRRWMRTAAERAAQPGRRPGAGLAPTAGAPVQSTTDARVGQAMALAEKYRRMEEAGNL